MELATQPYCERQLHNKDETVDGDADHGDDVVCRGQVHEDLELPHLRFVDTKHEPLDVHNSKSHTDTDGHDGDEGTAEENEQLLIAVKRAADDVDLQDQAGVDDSVGQEAENLRRD